MKGVGRKTRSPDGKFHINGKTYEELVGSRRMVWNGSAYKTSHGRKGLTRGKLMQNKRGRLVSISLHNRAKRENRLGKAGWELAKKGTFGAVRISAKGTRKAKGRGTKRRRRPKSGKHCRNTRGHFKKC